MALLIFHSSCIGYVLSLARMGLFHGTFKLLLNNNKIAISMTEDYNPTDNAIAERINGIIKTELVYQLRLMEDVTQARECIGRYIDFYNDRRPHMSIDYKTPAAAHLQTGELNKKWKKKKYPNKKKNDEENELYLQNRTTSQGEGICQQF